MAGSVASIWRHPIKSHGRETLDEVVLTAGETMPWDRAWAVLHSNAKEDGTTWARCVNFQRGARIGQLQAINATLDEASQTVTLTHPQLAPLTFLPDQDQDAFLSWVKPLVDPDGNQPVKLVRVPNRGMTDTDYPTLSICNPASNAALGAHLGAELDQGRWRGNIWVDGLSPWEERAWPGQTLRIGGAEIEVVEEIERCTATMANPATGERDADTLAGLRDMQDGSFNFGVYGVVKKSGLISKGDKVSLI